MINLHWVYALGGAMWAAFAVLSLGDRTNPHRFGNALLWALVAVSFWFGDMIGDLANGILVLAIALVAGARLIGRSDGRSTSVGQRHVFLNPRRAAEIRRLIDEGDLPSGMKLPSA